MPFHVTLPYCGSNINEDKEVAFSSNLIGIPSELRAVDVVPRSAESTGNESMSEDILLIFDECSMYALDRPQC